MPNLHSFEKWNTINNVYVTATKKKHLSKKELGNILSKLLRSYCINENSSEQELHINWMNTYKTGIKKQNCRSKIH